MKNLIKINLAFGLMTISLFGADKEAEIKKEAEGFTLQTAPLIDTCLWHSAATGSLKSVQYYLGQGGNKNIIIGRKSPLEVAAGVDDERHRAVVAYLLAQGVQTAGIEKMLKDKAFPDGQRLLSTHHHNLNAIWAQHQSKKAQNQ